MPDPASTGLEQPLLKARQGDDDEAHPGNEFVQVKLDLGDHPPWRSQEAA